MKNVIKPIIPMRPIEGPKLTAGNILDIVAHYKEHGCICQPKLNGDRGLLQRTDAGIIIWNRYGEEYSFAAEKEQWMKLSPDTILDGEIYGGVFHPFECLSLGDVNWMNIDAQGRMFTARELCTRRPAEETVYLFNEPTEAWLKLQVAERTNPRTRRWEGLVFKKTDSPYVPLKKPDHESPTWIKCKW